MLNSTSLVPDDWSGLISRVAGDLDLDALAKETRALVRRRGVPDAQALLRLVLARGPGGMSLRQTAAWAHLRSHGEVDSDRRSGRVRSRKTNSGDGHAS